MGRKQRRRHHPAGVTSPLESPGTRGPGTPLEEVARISNTHEERRGVGDSSGVGGLYRHQDFAINPQRTKSFRFLPSGRGSRFLPSPLRLEMKTVNALNLQPARNLNFVMGRKSHQRNRLSLARVDELHVDFPGRRSNDSKLEPLEVNNDSSGSDGSSEAALRFLQYLRLCDSSENEPPESDVPTCLSLTSGSYDGEESVGSSSVAEPCTTECKHAVPSV